MINNLTEKIVSLCKRRGFVFQGSEIYGGFSGFWDYGPLGVELKNNISRLWWKRFVQDRDDMHGMDTAIVMNPQVWEASGHKDGFSDPLAKCEKCEKPMRVDSIVDNKCVQCGAIFDFKEARDFNMMFETSVGVSKHKNNISYLRPETAQGIFVNFKNIVDAMHPTIPFGVAQIGKAFRNEISPRDFTFRSREFEQMEIEYFVRANEWEKYFEHWRAQMCLWIRDIGISDLDVSEVEVGEHDRAHYSKKTLDFEFEFPFGKRELYGLAYRTDFDLSNHSAKSGVDLSYRDQVTSEIFIPHVIEPTFGLDRSFFAVLVSAYNEDELGGEKRMFLKLPIVLAPVKVAVFPLLRNKPDLVERAQAIYKKLHNSSHNALGKIVFDDNGNIGKRYRRQDEIGTPFCVTVDFQTLDDSSITVRERDSGAQERVSEDELASYLAEKLR
jgi:glycyl-tRNA synthetase